MMSIIQCLATTILKKDIITKLLKPFKSYPVKLDNYERNKSTD